MNLIQSLEIVSFIGLALAVGMFNGVKGEEPKTMGTVTVKFCDLDIKYPIEPFGDRLMSADIIGT